MNYKNDPKITPQLVDKLSEKCLSILPLSKELDQEFFYSNLHFCVIDTVFSIGVRYGGVKNVVRRTSEYFDQPNIFALNRIWPDRNVQISITQFLELIKWMSPQRLANEVFGNQQRTSTRNGILKAEAVVEFLKVLKNFKVDHFQDVERVFANVEFESAIKKIKGQASGISLSYFYMLAGNDDLIKPDRMVMDFLFKNTGIQFSLEEAQIALFETAKEVSKKNNKSISARHLDNLIWGYQRVQKN